MADHAALRDGLPADEDLGDAEDARSGDVGPDGRCGSFVDRYVVRCPEASHEIFIDASSCAESA